MVEKIRVSLWDIFSFFLTGLLACAIGAVFVAVLDALLFSKLIDRLVSIPSAVVILAAPLILTLVGMIIEPFANYFDRFVLTWAFSWVSKPKEKHSAEEKILKEEIRSKYLGSLNGRIENPYAICKEYVETKQLSTTFMVYLSRYGFYRNCAFLSIVSGIAAIFYVPTFCHGLVVVLFGFIAAAVFKRRSEDFYSFMAPSVYRAFLIDKLSWTPKER